MVTSIDRKSPIPIYVQIAEQLRSLVRQAVVDEKDRFFTDDELIQMFKVSRMTIRQAVQVLVEENLLIRLKGSGTFLSANQKLSADIERLDTFFSGFYLDQNFKAMLLYRGIVPCPAFFAAKLGIEPQQKVTYIKRIRLIKDIPIVIDHRYMLMEYGEEISEDELTHFSLSHIFLPKFGVKFHEAALEIEARLADEEVAGILKVQQGSPILYRYTEMKVDNHRCLVVGDSYFRGDMYKYKSILRGT